MAQRPDLNDDPWSGPKVELPDDQVRLPYDIDAGMAYLLMGAVGLAVFMILIINLS